MLEFFEPRQFANHFEQDRNLRGRNGFNGKIHDPSIIFALVSRHCRFNPAARLLDISGAPVSFCL